MSRHSQICGQAYSVGPVQMADGYGYVKRAGDQMQGSLLAWRDAVQDMEFVTKRYVDSAVGAVADAITGGVSASFIPVDPAVAGATNVQAALEALEDAVSVIDCGTY